MIKGVLLSNIRDLNEAPYMERFVDRIHVPDTLSIYGPLLRRWHIYRSETSLLSESVPLDAYGAYNWTMVELHFAENPYAARAGLGSAGGALEEFFPPDYNERMGLPSGKDLKRAGSWPGCADLRLNAMIHVPLRPTESFVGTGLTLEDGPFVRWIQLLRVPDGVAEEEFEKWYTEVHAPEVAQMPHLKRFLSYRRLPELPGAFQRLSELWFADFSSWRRDVVENPPALTPPPWAPEAGYPFLQPFREMVSTFILERPTKDLLQRLCAYLYNC